LLAVGHLLDWGEAECQNLLVPLNDVHRAKPSVEIPLRREVGATSQSAQEIERRSSRYRTEALQAVRRNDVWKCIDDGHASHALVTSR